MEDNKTIEVDSELQAFFEKTNDICSKYKSATKMEKEKTNQLKEELVSQLGSPHIVETVTKRYKEEVESTNLNCEDLTISNLPHPPSHSKPLSS